MNKKRRELIVIKGMGRESAPYILRAMRDRDYKPKINPRTGTDYNDMNRAALNYAIEAIEQRGVMDADIVEPLKGASE